MRKVLYLIPEGSSYQYTVGNAFKSLGWKVKYFDYRKGDLPIRIYRFFPLIGGHQKAAKAVKDRIIKIANSYKPDIILTAKGELLDKYVLTSIKRPDNVLINLFPDYLNHWPLIKEISQYYDLFCTPDNEIINRLEKIGRKNVYLVSNATEIDIDNEREKIYDVSFVGTFRPWREEYLSNLKGLNFAIFGDHRWYNTSLKKYVRGGRISLRKMKDQVIKKTKVNINIYFDNTTPVEGVSLRPFEITGCGGFLLTQYTEDYENVYVAGKEFDYYKTPQEMRKKVEYYLKNDKEREKIAKAGYQRTIKDHTYKTRMTQLLKIVYPKNI